ncbi:unannotated protein [freshwater metagenome]|uniref:Unannotated protein n=1 Tax=freshwater metagenome TaxID=449393 RepID=A0A6J6JHH4_9ZZZZ
MAMNKLGVLTNWLNRALAVILIPTALAIYLFGGLIWGEILKAIGKGK